MVGGGYVWGIQKRLHPLYDDVLSSESVIGYSRTVFEKPKNKSTSGNIV